MNQQVGGVVGSDAEYEVRRFREGDRDAVLELHEDVSRNERGRAWFAWKFQENPSVYHVPIFVAERVGGDADGEVVAARPFFALELSVGGRRHVGLQPCDPLVHPDHRGQGLRTRLDEAAAETYRDGEFRFVFDFPAAACVDGYRALGWESVAEHRPYHRVQDPDALERSSTRWPSIAEGLLDRLRVTSARLSRHRLRLYPARGVTVETHDAVPARELASIEYHRHHHVVRAHRDVRFYEWRFADPRRSYTTHVAHRRGEPIAAVVVSTPADDEHGPARLVEVTPYPRTDVPEGLAALLRRVLNEHGHAPVITAPAALPSELAGRAGFSREAGATTESGDTTGHLVRELGHGIHVDGVDLADADNWAVTLADRDGC